MDLSSSKPSSEPNQSSPRENVAPEVAEEIFQRVRSALDSGLFSAEIAPRMQELFDRTIARVSDLLDVPVVLLSIVDGERQFFRASQNVHLLAGKKVDGTPISHSLCRIVRDSGAPLMIDDAVADEAMCNHPAVTELGVGAYLGCPVFSAEGLPIGSLCAIDTKPRHWAERDRKILEGLAEEATAKIGLFHSLQLAEREQKRAAASEAQLRTVVEALPVVVLTSNSDLETQSVSARAGDLLNIDTTVWSDQGWWNRIHPDDEAMLRQRMERDMRERNADSSAAFRLRTDDGEYLSVIARSAVLPQPIGDLHSVTTITDVSDLRRAEAQAEEERRRLRGAIDVAGVGLVIVDREGRIIEVNELGRTLFGVEPGLPRDRQQWRSAYLEGSPYPLSEQLARALEGESVREDQALEIEDAKGAVRRIQISARPVVDVTDAIEGAVLSATDITELQRAEEKARSTAGELQRRTAVLVDALPFYAAMLDLDGNILAANERASNALGLEKAQVIGASVFETLWFKNHSGTVEGLHSALGEVRGTGSAVRREMVISEGGGEREIEFFLNPISATDGTANAVSVMGMDVTERNAARRAAQIEMDRLVQVFEGLPIFAALCDREGTVLAVNQLPLDAVGVKREDVIGLSLWDTPWVQEPGVSELMRQSVIRVQNGESVLNEFSFPTPSGKPIEVEQRMSPIYGEDGEVKYILPTAMDVTERNETSRMIEIERRLLNDILDQMRISISLFDVDGKLIFRNGSFQSANRIESGALGKYIWELPWVPDEITRSELRVAFARAAVGDTTNVDVKAEFGEGMREFDTTIAPIKNVDGSLRYVLAQSVDVTERNRYRRALEAEGTQLRQIIESLPVMVKLLDPTGRILFANQTPARLIGFPEEELTGRMFWDSAWHRPYSDRIRREIEIAASGGTAVDEFTFIGPSGRIDVEQQVAPIYAPNGELRFLLAAAVNVTERNLSQQQLREEGERLGKILDTIPIAIGLHDTEGRSVYANKTALDGAGIKAEDIRGTYAWETPYFSGETVEIVKKANIDAKHGIASFNDIKLNLKDIVLDCEYTVNPILDPEGAVENIVVTAIDVTARNEAQRMLQDESRRLLELIDSLGVIVALHDLDGRVVYGNAEFLRLVGQDLASTVGRPFWELPLVADLPEIQDALETCFLEAKAQENSHCELTLNSPEGPRDFDILYAPFRLSSGATQFIVSTLVDVTDRKQATAQIESERRRLRSIVEALPIGLIVYDADRKITDFNEEALSILDLSLEQLQTRQVHTGYYIEADGHETPAPLETAPLTRALKGESGREPRSLHLVNRDPSHPDLYVRAEAAAIFDADRNVEGAVFTVMDVRPLRDAQQALSAELRTGAERLRHLVEGLSIYVALLDMDGRVVYVNEAPLRDAGTSLAAVEGLLAWETPWFQERTDVQNFLQESMLVARAGEEVRQTIDVYSLNGAMEVDFTLTPIRDAEGEISYLLASGVDVTERNRALAELKSLNVETNDARVSAERAKEAAERASRAKDEFLSVLSHELRTPLTPAMLGLDLMQADLEVLENSGADADSIESFRETFATVRTNLELQVRLIDDLLDITRIARGKLELQRRAFDLHTAAEHAYEICKTEAETKGVPLEYHPDAPQSTIDGDPARIRQILWNLVANAIKFTPTGGLVTITSYNPAPNIIEIAVHDTGRGIESDQISKIFDAFEQGGVGVTRAFGGLGLGLAISKSLATAHNAELSVSSEGLGAGATFRLRIATIDALSEIKRSDVAALHLPKSLRILLVEDNPDTARITAELLKRSGAIVTLAQSVAEAEAAMAISQGWDLLLTDLGLPDGNGIDVLHRLRTYYPDIPAVAMSGYGTESDKARTKEAGFRAHLVKPVSFGALEEALGQQPKDS